MSSKVTADILKSTIPTGTVPLIIASTTKVDNLNADLLDGEEASAFAKLTGGNTFTGVQTISQDGNGALDMNASDNTYYSELSWSQNLVKKWGVYVGVITDLFPGSWSVYNYVLRDDGFFLDTSNNLHTNAKKISIAITNIYDSIRWTLGTGWEGTNVGNTILDKYLTGTGTAVYTNEVPIVVDSTYVVKYTSLPAVTVPTPIAGTCSVSFAGSTLTQITSIASGSVMYEIVASNTNPLTFTPASTSFRGSIQGLEVYEKVATTGQLVADGDLVISTKIKNTWGQLLASITPSLGWTITGTLNILGAFTTASTGTFTGVLRTNSSTDATNTTTAALVSAGGLAVLKKSFFGDLMNLLGGINVTGVSVFNSSINLPYVEKTATYTLTDSDYTVNCTANTFNITLPTAVGKQGRIYNVKNTGLGTITVNTTSSETIDGELTQTLVKPTNMQIQSTNANWIIL